MRVYDVVIAADFQPVDLQAISRTASRFISDIIIEYNVDEANRVSVDVKSLLGMMTLAIHKGTRITIKTKGKDEKEAIDYLTDLIERYK
ncbi:HPr family phosphocarrier protein [Paenibacillus chartarius]|uniref:HPr family phosphocarrier protein n=1 Tax=Paenibacillus chartarius TaxID=747481 RepID=A0ABV6DE39_9BACL